MEYNKIDAFILANGKYFPPEKLKFIQERLEYVDDDFYVIIASINYKDPVLMLIISIFFGYLGIDRFILGDIGMGVLKLLTGGCCGVLLIADWIRVMSMTREKNFEDLLNVIAGY